MSQRKLQSIEKMIMKAHKAMVNVLESKSAIQPVYGHASKSGSGKRRVSVVLPKKGGRGSKADKFFRGVKKGLSKVGKDIYHDVVQPVGNTALGQLKTIGNNTLNQLKDVAKNAASQGLSTLLTEGAVGAGRRRKKMSKKSSKGGSKKPKSKAQLAAQKRMIERSKVVKKVMNAKGLSMIEASQYVKDHDLF